MWTLYIIRCTEPNHFYVGITTDFNRRYEQHKMGRQSKGAAFTNKYGVAGYKIVADNINTYQVARNAEDILVARMVDKGYNVTGGKWARFLGAMVLRQGDIDVEIQHWPWCNKNIHKSVHECATCRSN